METQLELENNKKGTKRVKSVTYAKWGLIFIIPFFVTYIIFTFIPQILTVGYSFVDYYEDSSVFIGPNFVGLKNYINLFQKNPSGHIAILKYLGNTIILWVIGAIPQFVVALLLAVIFTSTRLNIKGQRFFKTVFYLPNVIMASAFALLVVQLFAKDNAPINDIMASMGMQRYDFLANEWSVRSLIGLMNYLMWFGNTTILLMAGIQGIDEKMFESARLDGAGSFRIFKDITMPLLKPIFIYVFITSMIGGLQMYDAPQVLTNGNGTPDTTSTTVVMFLNIKMQGRNYGEAGAISMLLFAFTAVLSIVIYKSMAKDEK